jgi:hypothetical protein
MFKRQQNESTYGKSVFNTVHLEEKGSTYHKKRKRENHDLLASSTVQGTNDVREVWQALVKVFNTVHLEEKGSTYHKKGQEGMCTGYRYGTAFCDVMQSTV